MKISAKLTRTQMYWLELFASQQQYIFDHWDMRVFRNLQRKGLVDFTAGFYAAKLTDAGRKVWLGIGL